MFNISENVQIEGIDELGISKSHLVACMHDKNCCEPTQYSYFGKVSSKGTKKVKTKAGTVLVTFEEKNGWATKVRVEAL